MHGAGGSAGVGVLLIASVRSTALAVAALLTLAIFAAVSMSLLSTVFGSVLTSYPVRATFGVVAPALGGAGLAFAVWYATAVWT